MLKYIEICISHMEVPGESCLCIYVSGCPNHCKNCHYPDLQSPDYGDELGKSFDDIMDLYKEYATCVCFMGEGDCSISAQKEHEFYADKIFDKGMKSCLYSGRDCDIEEWMRGFDYIKVGSYKEEYGSLIEKTTNQRFYGKTSNGYRDSTYMFWD